MAIPVPNSNDLVAWRSDLENAARSLDAMIEQYKSKADEIRGKIKAVDVLLGDRVSGSEQSVPSAIANNPGDSEKVFTPVHEYWPAILESLIELGGRGKRENVVERVGNKLKSVLTREDMELLPSGLDVRWKNRVAWQRLNMLNQGLLRADSARGTWEITQAGRKWLEDQKKAVTALELRLRLAELCHKSSPECEVMIAPSSVPSHIRLKVVDDNVEILSPNLDIAVEEWMAKSDEQLWDLLESISNTRIRRPLG
jgi:hypothetical protein